MSFEKRTNSAQEDEITNIYNNRWRQTKNKQTEQKTRENKIVKDAISRHHRWLWNVNGTHQIQKQSEIVVAY